MASFSAKDVQALRQRTGAGMMDCKKALEECDGNQEKAVEWLRMKGIAKAEKRAERAASEGRIVRIVDGGVGTLIEVNSETDFVSRNDEFGALADALAKQVHQDKSVDAIVANATEHALGASPWHLAPGKTVLDAVKEASGKTGENVVFRRFARFASPGVIGSYLHHNGRVAVLVDVAGATGPEVKELADSIAEHVAAGVPRVPLATKREDVPQDVVDRERRIFAETAQQSGKPANIIEKMVDGQVAKFYGEVVLMEQPWVRDDTVKIKDRVAAVAKAIGKELEVRRFVRFQMGAE